MDLIFFGMQGAGKGTVGKEVAAKFNLKIFETGGALRVLAQEDSELGHKVKEIIEAGRLVPNEVVMEIVEDFINKLEPGQSVLFDGIPRSVQQAESLNTLLAKHNREYKGVLIEITEETAIARLTTRKLCSQCKTVYPGSYEGETCNANKEDGSVCGAPLTTRADDNPESIHTRLEAFRNETLPAIAIYEEKMIKIDGQPDMETVKVNALSTLEPLY